MTPPYWSTELQTEQLHRNPTPKKNGLRGNQGDGKAACTYFIHHGMMNKQTFKISFDICYHTFTSENLQNLYDDLI